MNLSTRCFAVCFVIVTHGWAGEPAIRSGDKVAFLGDSGID